MLECILDGHGLGYIVTIALEQAAQCIADDVFVFNDEYLVHTRPVERICQ
jgi:hypothetical protein